MPTPQQPLLVSAASSLTDVLPPIGQAFVRKYPKVPLPRFNFAASGVLVKQMEAGAPVDVFVSASVVETDELQKKGFLAGPTVLFAGNRLVLVVPSGGMAQTSPIKTWDDLRGAGVKHIALSNPETVPSGRIAREVLQNRHLWDAVQAKLVRGENVRQTLAYAARGDVDAAFVFFTDAQTEKSRVRIVLEARAGRGLDYAQAIAYPACVLARSPRKEVARQFAEFLTEKPAQTILQNFGFTPAPPALRTTK